MTNKKIPTGTIFLFSLLLLVILATYVLTKPSPPPPELTGVLRPEFKPLHPFKLTDQNNIIFDEKRFQKKWSFIFFGYTSCPDICPTTLNILNSVQVLLDDETKENLANTQVVFVSVDPARDTPEVLATYMSYFNKNFIGVTADKNEINNFARQFGAGYVLEKETAPGQYLVAHSSAIFLVDPHGRLVATFSQPHYPAIITSQYKKIRAYFLQ